MARMDMTRCWWCGEPEVVTELGHPLCAWHDTVYRGFWDRGDRAGVSEAVAFEAFKRSRNRWQEEDWRLEDEERRYRDRAQLQAVARQLRREAGLE